MKLTRREVEMFGRREWLIFPIGTIVAYGGGVLIVLRKRGLMNLWHESVAGTIVFLLWGGLATLLGLWFLRVHIVARRSIEQPEPEDKDMSEPQPDFMRPGTLAYYDTRIDCAAVKSTDGRVWTGKRHHHCIATIVQAGLKVSHGDQGFVTMSGRYVDREEAAELILKTGQCKLNHPPLAYSEDLY